MSQEPMHDPRLLRNEAYADASCLDVRYQTHRRYTVDPVDFGRWTLERLSWRGDERVLDVGCGPGTLLIDMARQHEGWGALVGLDFSPGMIPEAAAAAGSLPARFLVADAQALPFPDACFDVVMARHMLYHVPDIDRAVAEAARVLVPGGAFLAVTNSAHTMAEYWALTEETAVRFPGMRSPERRYRFSLENGASFLTPYFAHVETHRLPGTLRFPEAEPLVGYFASTRALTLRPGHTESEWQAILKFVRARVQDTIDRDGHFDVGKLTGAFVGRKGG